MSEEIKCDFCGKKSIETCYFTSWKRSTRNMDELWKVRESGIGFEGWITVCEKCLNLLKSITDQNSMKVETKLQGK